MMAVPAEGAGVSVSCAMRSGPRELDGRCFGQEATGEGPAVRLQRGLAWVPSLQKSCEGPMRK